MWLAVGLNCTRYVRTASSVLCTCVLSCREVVHGTVQCALRMRYRGSMGGTGPGDGEGTREPGAEQHCWTGVLAPKLLLLVLWLTGYCALYAVRVHSTAQGQYRTQAPPVCTHWPMQQCCAHLSRRHTQYRYRYRYRYRELTDRHLAVSTARCSGWLVGCRPDAALQYRTTALYQHAAIGVDVVHLCSYAHMACTSPRCSRSRYTLADC